MLSTPYYNTKVDISYTKCGNMSSSNYQPYNLFCLITQLETFLAERGRPQSLSCISVEENSRMELKVKTTLSDPSEISQAQAELDDIINNRPLFSLLFSVRLNQKYPQSWLRTILPFLPLPSDFNPFIYRNNLYVNLALSDNFLVLYKVLLIQLEKTLAEWYDEGYVVNAEEIGKSWNLICLHDKDPFQLEIENTSLYRPSWQDKRFAPQAVEFLLSRLRGEKEIVFTLLPSYPVLHSVALLLEEKKIHFTFILGEESWRKPRLITQVENLEEAVYVANLIEEASYNMVGEVEIKRFSSKEDAQREKGVNSVIYNTLGELEPYVLSKLKNFTI